MTAVSAPEYDIGGPRSSGMSCGQSGCSDMFAVPVAGTITHYERNETDPVFAFLLCKLPSTLLHVFDEQCE